MKCQWLKLNERMISLPMGAVDPEKLAFDASERVSVGE